LATLVNERLEVITKHRRQTRLELTDSALQPGLCELSETLKPIQQSTKAGYSAVATMRSFLYLAKQVYTQQAELTVAFGLCLEAALKANQSKESLLYDIETAAADCEDCVNVLERLILKAGSLHLSEIVISAQDLARTATKLDGGFPLPEFTTDPIIYTKGTLAIAIVTNCLLGVAAELWELGSTNGIQVGFVNSNELAELTFTAQDFGASACESAIDPLIKQLGGEPSVSIAAVGKEIRLGFKTIKPDISKL